MSSISEVLKSIKINNIENKHSNEDGDNNKSASKIFIIAIIIFIILISTGIYFIHKTGDVVAEVNKEIVQKNYIDNADDLSEWLFDENSKNFTLVRGNITSNELVKFSDTVKTDEVIEGVSDNSYYRIYYKHKTTTSYKNTTCRDCRMLDVINIDFRDLKFSNTEDYGYETGTFTYYEDEYIYEIYNKLPEHYALVKKDNKCNIDVLMLSDTELSVQEKIKGLSSYTSIGLAIIIVTILVYWAILPWFFEIDFNDR